MVLTQKDAEMGGMSVISRREGGVRTKTGETLMGARITENNAEMIKIQNKDSPELLILESLTSLQLGVSGKTTRVAFPK